jgi:hypothetical protein
MAVNSWNGHTKDALHGHRMATITPIMEKATCALPLTIVIGSGMDIVLTVEFGLETSKLDTLWFVCVALGFCDFADHT